MWNLPNEKSLRKIPRLYETEDIEVMEKLIYLHFFLGSSDWFVAEFDGVGIQDKDKWDSIQDDLIDAMIKLDNSTKSWIKKLE